MGNSVKRRPAAARGAAPTPAQSETGLYTRQGARKYLTRDERQRVLAVLARQGTDGGLLAQLIAWSGCRVSEALNLSHHSFDVEAGLVAIITLKRRRLAVREVPIPHELMRALDRRFALTKAGDEHGATPTRLWSCCRATVWRQMKTVMAEAGITGRAACPRGLRHAFGVGTLQAGVPMTLLQKWMGHARMTTTALYADVSGPEEHAFAKGFWRWSGGAAG